MSDQAVSLSVPSGAAHADALGPSGPKPRHIFSRRNIFLYGTLIVAALYYLLPLYVMIVIVPWAYLEFGGRKRV